MDEGALVPIKLTHEMAWFLKCKILPGHFLHPAMDDVFDLLVGLRKKIDYVLLAYADLGEDYPEDIEVQLTPEEAWAVDSFIPFDGPGQPGTTIFYQLFRGLSNESWAPAKRLVEDPNDSLSKEDVMRMLRERPE